MYFTSAARVVDLPLPVGPVISTMPIGRSQKSSSTEGRLSVSTSRISYGIRRKATAIVPR